MTVRMNWRVDLDTMSDVKLPGLFLFISPSCWRLNVNDLTTNMNMNMVINMSMIMNNLRMKLLLSILSSSFE